jgi:hypothetical protein
VSFAPGSSRPSASGSTPRGRSSLPARRSPAGSLSGIDRRRRHPRPGHLFRRNGLLRSLDARGVKYRSELADESGDGVRAGGRSVVGGEGEAVGRR